MSARMVFVMISDMSGTFQVELNEDCKCQFDLKRLCVSFEECQYAETDIG